MYPRQALITLRLSPSQAEVVYYELLGLIAHYAETAGTLDAEAETALRLAITQLNAGLARANALGELQLEQLRAITSKEVA